MKRLAAVLVVVALTGCAAGHVWTTSGPRDRLKVEVRERGGESCIQVGTRREGCFDGLALDGLTFSGDGRHAAYPARSHHRWVVVRDGTPSTPWDGLASLVFNADGSHLAYAAFGDFSWKVVIDERAGADYDSLIAGSIVWSPRGTKVAYAAERAGRTHIVVNGLEGPGYDAVGSVRFSPDDSRFAYPARSGDQAILVKDGAESPPHDAISEIAWSRDGGHLAYAMRNDDRWWVVDDSVASGPFASVRRLAFRADGALCYIAANETGEHVVIGDAIGPTFDSIQELVLSEQSSRWACIAQEGKHATVIINGTAIRVEERASSLVLNPDGLRFAYIAERGPRALLVDETGAHPFDLLIERSVLFCWEGQAWACIAGDRLKRRLFVVVEGSSDRRPLDWNVLARLTRRVSQENRDPDRYEETLRSWVAAEAEKLPHPPLRR